MKSFLKDIFDYNHHFNQKIAQIILENSNEVDEKAIQLFSHSIVAHEIWNSRILQKEPPDLNKIHPIEISKERDVANFNKSIEIIENCDLNLNVSYQNSKGEKFRNTIQEILFHVCNHFSHHRGQIILILRNNGVKLPITDYVFYKR